MDLAPALNGWDGGWSGLVEKHQAAILIQRAWKKYIYVCPGGCTQVRLMREHTSM